MFGLHEYILTHVFINSVDNMFSIFSPTKQIPLNVTHRQLLLSRLRYTH